MKTVLKALDKAIVWIVSNMVTVAMALILFIVFVQVLARFAFKASIGGWEEIPVYMLLVGTWLTAAINVKRKDHISLDLYELFIKSPKIRRFIKISTDIITAAAFAYFTYLAYDMVAYNFAKGYATSGAEIPLWLLAGTMMLSTALMVIYYVVNIINAVKELRTCK